MLTCIWREGWSGAAQVFGGEQFLFFFLTAGMVSSLTSYAGRLRSLKGGHSLGASGAVYACFAGMAILYPGMHALLPHACTLIVISSCSCPTQLCNPAHPRLTCCSNYYPGRACFQEYVSQLGEGRLQKIGKTGIRGM